MNKLESLEKTKALLSSPDKWTKGAMAHDANRNSVGWGHPDAVCWCLSGALAHVCGGINERWSKGLWALSNAIRPADAAGVSIAIWNDNIGRTYDDVINILDKAIAKEKLSEKAKANKIK
jgi:hypothetical protein